MADARVEPGVYLDMAEHVYHADPCPVPSLSRSVAKTLAYKTPKHAWAAHSRLNLNVEPVDKTEFDIGRAAHAMMLRQPEDFVVIDAPDWRKGAAKDARETAWLENKTPLLIGQHERVAEMVAAGRAQLAVHEDDADAFTVGNPEITLIWTEKVGKMTVWLRVRLDWATPGWATIYDYKSTGDASPDNYERPLYGNGYDFQGAFYRRGVRALGLHQSPKFVLVVQEKAPPYALATGDVHEHVMDEADAEVERAIAIWAWCLEQNVWPGYPARRITFGRPGYVEAKQLDRQVRRELAPDAHKAWLRWQAPHERKAS